MAEHDKSSDDLRHARHQATQVRDVLGNKPVWLSQDLFGEEDEVLVLHGDQIYRLRRTRNGKLILGK